MLLADGVKKHTLKSKILVSEGEVAMEDASRSTLTNVSEQVVNVLNNTATQFAAHPSSVAASGLPVAAMFGFVPGLMTGLKKG